MEFEEDVDEFDPERLIQCPLVKHHWIRARRFPYHLVKCKESNPEIAKKLATCPFNARHLVPKADLGDHIMKCSDKAFMEQDVGAQGTTGNVPPKDGDVTIPRHKLEETLLTKLIFSARPVVLIPPFLWGEEPAPAL
ncbi:hypothetical protein DUI87_22032 [Hirundo rustica rustica]|uniref:CHHC U11-48K-type domain-containing protein n=1 Tax=Hirundo rustica rustica TaxID=333673 RepID=A0A3M0JMQ9_HIRRU|nr:hypothetical protein DUI87_22032 [Hirundo rustica rustica]